MLEIEFSGDLNKIYIKQNVYIYLHQKASPL